MNRAVLLCVLCASLLLAGCKSELYTNLVETEANQMLAVLLTSGIAAEKIPVKDGFSITVDDKQVLRALAVLDDRGLPSVRHTSIGQVFQKSGIMSSPFEEKVRYISALGDEVARTISFIDGVVAARVHIVQPDPPQLGRQAPPASAAVFIKHQPGVDLDFFVPQIRRLVSSSIEGLDYANVTVILSAAVPLKQVGETALADEGLGAARAATGGMGTLLIIAGALVLLGGAGGAGFYFYRRNRSGGGRADDEAHRSLEPT